MTDYHKTGLPSMISVTEIATLFTRTFQPGVQPGEEAHPFWEFVYVERGSLFVKLGENVHSLSAGDMIFYPPEMPHCSHEPIREETVLSVVSFSSVSPELSRFGGRVTGIPESLQTVFREMMDAGCGIFQWYEEDDGEQGMYLREDADLLQLCAVKQRLEYFLTALICSEDEGADWRSSYDRGRLDSVVEYLQGRIGQELTVEQIARDCLIGTSVLKRLFRQYMGQGVMAYFNLMKLSRAKELLRSGNMTVAEVAESLGFSSQFYFSRLFKQKNGISPTEYREQK